MIKSLLLQHTDRELSLEEVESLVNKCLICEKLIAVPCGTPVVHWGGCCVGIKTPTTMYLRPRKAHFHCALKAYGLGDE